MTHSTSPPQTQAHRTVYLLIRETGEYEDQRREVESAYSTYPRACDALQAVSAHLPGDWMIEPVELFDSSPSSEAGFCTYCGAVARGHCLFPANCLYFEGRPHHQAMSNQPERGA